MKLPGKYWHTAAALALALVSVIINPPAGETVVAWDWAPCFLLLTLLFTVTGMKHQHLFDAIDRNIPYFRKTWFLLLVLDALSFVMGALITGFAAVAVILPAAERILREKERERLVPGTLGMLTLGAIAGSMLLPTGSPANLLLSFYGADVFMTLWPFSLTAFAVSLLAIPVILKGKINDTLYLPPARAVPVLGNSALKMLYVCLCLTVVLSAYNVIFWLNETALVVIILLLFDREVFRKTDYSIPLTMLFLTIASHSLSIGPVSFPLEVLAAEISGSTLSAFILAPGALDAAGLLKAVNIGSLPLFSSMPVIKAMGKTNDRKGFLKAYLACALPAFLILCVLAYFL